MQLQTRKENDVLILSVTGRLDFATTADFENQCAIWLAEGCCKIVLDCSALEYIGSMGLRGVMLAASKAQGAGGYLVVCGVSGLVTKILCEAGFHNLIPMYPTISAALKGQKKK